MHQTTTISKKMEAIQEMKMNKSAISKEDRPTTGIYTSDNPFNLSRMGYANPADRNLPSAMKARPRVNRTPEAPDATWRTKQLQAQINLEMGVQPLYLDDEEGKQGLLNIGDNPSTKSSQQSKRGMQSRQQPHGVAPEETAFLPRDKIPRTPLKKT